MFDNNCLRTAAVLLAFLSPPALADELTDRAQALVDEGKPAEAFRLLDPLEAERAGDVNFDLVFGAAAIDAGQNTRAVFALERVLAVQPNNARARAEIARAYFALGETDAARQEFETVQKQGIPPEVSRTVDRFLDAVDRLDLVSRPTLRGFLETSFGYDSNVNAATTKGSIAVPAFGGQPFTLTASSQSTDAWFATLGGGVVMRTPINNEWAVVGGLSGVLRNNFGAREFDSLNGDAYAGVVLTRDRHVFSLNAQFNQYELASDRYRTAAGLSGQWQFNLSARDQLSAFVQYSDLSYPGQSPRDADRWVGGGAFAHAYRGGEVAFASAYGVTERVHEDSAPWNSFDGGGVRVGGQMNFNPRTVLFVGASIEARHYGAEDPSFLKTRKDTQYDLVLGADYTPARYWKVTPRLTLTANESNIEINKYHREAISVVLRRDF